MTGQSTDDVFSFWSHFLLKESFVSSNLPDNCPSLDPGHFSHLNDFVTVEIVLATYLPYSTSAGVESVSASILRKVPSRVYSLVQIALGSPVLPGLEN